MFGGSPRTGIVPGVLAGVGECMIADQARDAQRRPKMQQCNEGRDANLQVADGVLISTPVNERGDAR